MKSQTSKTTDEAKAQAASMSDMADALRKNWEQALRTSLKLQEESGRWWSSIYNPASAVQQWQEQLTAATRTANGLMPLVQKPVAEMVDFLEKSTQTSAELFKMASEAAQTPAGPDCQSKWSELWTQSLKVARSNAEALAQVNVKAIDSWAEFLRKTGEAGTLRAA